MYQILSYITFLCRATNHHGVHSPFIYHFVTQCLYDKTTYKAYKNLKSYRHILLTSKVNLEINDLGQGSKVLDANYRKVSTMAKTSSSSRKDAKLLFRLSNYFKFNTILELGTSLGMGTYALYLGNTNTDNITTIEGCKNTSNFTQNTFKKLGITNCEFKIGAFNTEIKHLNTQRFDAIYFDGHHNKTATLEYFESLLPLAHNDSVFIFDDIYWSKEMTEAWEIIKQHPNVTVTVDCFSFGFVFFRKEQAKEHFKIRL